MNQAGPQGQGGPQQAGPGQQQQQPVRMYRPEQMRSITVLSQEEKQKYETGLRQLWTLYETNPEGSPERESAKRKIQDFTPVLMKKVRERALAVQARGNQAQQAGGSGGVPQIPQGGASGLGAGGKPNIGGAGGEMTTTGAGPAGSGGPPPGPQQLGHPQKIPEGIQHHLNQMTYHPPPNIADKSPEMVAKWQEEARRKYASSLMQMEALRNQLSKFDAGVKARAEKGQPFTPEEQKTITEKKAQLNRAYEEAARFITTFRKQQEMLNQAQGKPNSAAGAAAGAGAAQAPTRPQAAPQQQAQFKNQAQAQAQATGLQNSQANINGAIEAAKKEQIAAAGRLPGTAQQAQPTGQVATTSGGPQASPATQTHAAAAASGAAASIKTEPGLQTQSQTQLHHPQSQQPHPQPPPVNTALAAAVKAGMPSAGTPTQNSARIQTPQSAIPQSGVPRALSHQKALEEANKQRTTSVSGSIPQAPGHPSSAGAAGSGTPSIISGGPSAMAAQQQQQQQHHQQQQQQLGHPHAHPNQQTATLPSKMPIPKQLPERATQIPQPVTIGGGIAPGRPTLTGGSGQAGGVLSQPAVSKVPPIQMEGEGERVLNKKKLDELVRQVCGGTAEGQEGNLLMPEVEESILNLADSFVDDVLHSACRNAKERGSKVLEIRDIQLVLERTYNIRIPGYSSDELRTVRKIQPSMAWISKMSIVQAAKVTSGKGDT